MKIYKNIMETSQGNLENTQIVLLPRKEFYEWSNFLVDVLGKADIEGEETAFAVKMESQYYIVINNDDWIELPHDYRMILLAHETAHLEGSVGEEDADLEAMKYLNLEQIEILTDMWEDRHGHEYKE